MEKEERMFTAAEVEKILEKRFAKMEAQAEERVRQAREKALAEAQALADDMPDVSASIRNSEFDRRERILQERERLLAEREMRAKAVNVLAEKGLPAELADILVMSKPEEFEKNFEILEREFRKEVRAEIDKRLAASSAPLTRGSSWHPPVDSAVKIAQRMKEQEYSDKQKANEVIAKYL